MDILNFFSEAVKRGASDLHLVSGCVPTVRLYGDLVSLSDTPLDEEELKEGLAYIADTQTLKTFEAKRELDFAFKHEGYRFRINLHYQEGTIGISARLIPTAVPKPEEIGMDEIIYKLTHLKDGLILVVGPTGSGKSTTLASMISIINKERRSHIITIEDPIEFLFVEDQSIIEQRELGSDTFEFSTALKHALREDPNVIMVGEMRDIDTISAALTAAETGHLVLSTLHTSNAPETIQRIIDAYPLDNHQQILNQLAMNLRAVIAQHLIPTVDNKQVAVREILINTRAVANLIRSNQIEQIYSVMQTGLKEGMITMNKAIEHLYKKGIISDDVAKNRMRNLETLAVYY